MVHKSTQLLSFIDRIIATHSSNALPSRSEISPEMDKIDTVSIERRTGAAPGIIFTLRNRGKGIALEMCAHAAFFRADKQVSRNCEFRTHDLDA